MNVDFGYDGDKSTDTGAASNTTGDTANTTDLTTGKTNNDVAGIPADDINSISDSGQTVPKGTGATGFDNGDAGKGTNTDTTKTGEDDKSKSTGTEGEDNKSKVELVEGSVIEINNDKYTVDKNLNVLDKDGNIFKEAKDTKEWIDSFDSIQDADTALNIATIQDAIGIEIVDDNDQPIVFEDTPTGVKAYIEAVNEHTKDTHYQEAINTLYQRYPVVQDFINYYIANGNSVNGFGEVQDRSNITIDDTNEAQQESIIRTAWSEQGRKGDVEGYITYLKSSGTLTATAKEELSGLQEADSEYKAELAAKATEAEEQQAAKLEAYWNQVRDTIKSKNIGGYQIPDTIIVNRDGKKTSATPTDFYNYVYQVDKDGKSAYEKDLAKDKPTDRTEDELLRAYLRFVGGNYSNLVEMAVNKQKVAAIRLSAKTRTANSVKISPPKTDKAKTAGPDFGYN